MTAEVAFYVVNTLITAVLAVVMTHYWFHRGRTSLQREWMISAWVLVAADLIFAVRPSLPYPVARTIPTLMVTVAQVVLLLAAQRTADATRRRFAGVGLVALHFVLLATFVAVDAADSHLRTASNGIIWGGLALACAWYLQRGPRAFRDGLISPAGIFLVHGIFHLVRTGLAIWFEAYSIQPAEEILSNIGDLEVAFFVVGLYGTLLVADLLTRTEELTAAARQVRTLRGLLPMCSWCGKVRDDEGYWGRVDEYIKEHSEAEVTHSICSDCSAKAMDELATPPDGIPGHSRTP